MSDEHNKVLVVDDAQEVLDLLENILINHDYVVQKAHDGQEALDAITADAPDVIILDVMMPGMDGFTFYKELKRNKDTAQIPIIVLTVRERMEDTFLAMGATSFMTKPFDVEKLLNIIRRSIKAEKLTFPNIERDAKPEPSAAEKPKVVEIPDEKFAKRVLLAGNTPVVVKSISQILQQNRCGVTIVESERQIVNDALDLRPDFLMLDVLINNRASFEIIKKIKRMPEFKDTQILTFSFLDKDSLEGQSIHQVASDIDKARRQCLEAGATEYLGGFDESAFTRIIKKYAAQ